MAVVDKTPEIYVPEMAEGTLAVRNDQRGDVALGFCYGSIQPAFLLSMVAFMGADRDRQRIGAMATGAGLYIDETRNLVVRQFLDTSCTWLWFLDTDIGFPADALERLLDATDDGARKIVAGSYWAYHTGGNITTWLSLRGDGLHAYKSVPPSGVHPIAACGMGCTLIHRDVFEKIRDQRASREDPWIWFGRDLVDVHGKPERTGEDISFCLRAQKAGFKIWGCADLTVEHYKTQPVQIPALVTCEFPQN